MRRALKLLGITTILATSSVAALAADAPSGPYLRLDSGFSWARDPGLNTTGTSPFFAGVMVNTTGDSLGNSFVFGGGAGYRINSMFRADFTLGYRGGYDLEGSGIGVAGKASTPVTVSKAGVRSFAGLLNGYWDVGTWGLFTPYVGAGIGFSANKVKDEKLSAAAVPGVTATVFGQERTSLAWDVTLGTAVRIADGFALDVGYRYIDLGKASLGPNGLLTTTATTLTFPTTRTPSDFSLRANEIQVGLRYSF